MKRGLAFLLCLLSLAAVACAGEFTDSEPESVYEFSSTQVSQTSEILISAVGDVTLGGNMRGNPSSNIYTKALSAHDGDLSYFFANVAEIFAADDLTLVNFEGVLTNSTAVPGNKQENEFLFRAPPEHVEVLTSGSVEAVALENNHVMDFGETGYADTVATLEDAGIVYASEDSMGVYNAGGVSIALLAYQTFNDAYERLSEEMPMDVAAAKANYDVVIVSFHWGNEMDYAPHERQIALGRLAVDSGADLVLGHHSHRVNPIELYKGKYIVYSLGNFVFSGNSQPSDMDTFIFQQKMIVSGDGVTDGGFRIIPCSISSVTGENGKKSGENDFAATPFAPGSEAAQRVIDKMLENSSGLEYAVESYPTEWQ
ncbi:MAG TPA: CapA family protein [Candidatus Aphodomonas merdavium]|nr:CapA family protein [Candidatus Aphodomonas merdavium]